MVKQLGGDRQRLNEDGPTRVCFRLLLSVGIVLSAIVLAVWRHAG